MTAIILDGKKLATLSEEFIKKEVSDASFSWYYSNSSHNISWS